MTATAHTPDPTAVNSMFGRIARRYDLANHVLSGGCDWWWRWRLVRAVRAHAPRAVLDLATGSGDVAFALHRHLDERVTITGMDFCEPMLDEARRKQANRGLGAAVEFRNGDGTAIPLPDGVVDAVTVSFGLRNMADRPKAFAEARRVLRPGGHFYVLEFSQPWRWLRPFYYAYLCHVLPLIARRVTGDQAAYEYLGGSISAFPSHEALAAEARQAGFTEVTVKRFTGGIVALHIARA